MPAHSGLNKMLFGYANTSVFLCCHLWGQFWDKIQGYVRTIVAQFVRKLAYSFDNCSWESSFTTPYVWKLSPCWNGSMEIHLHRQQASALIFVGFLQVAYFRLLYQFLYLNTWHLNITFVMNFLCPSFHMNIIMRYISNMMSHFSTSEPSTSSMFSEWTSVETIIIRWLYSST